MTSRITKVLALLFVLLSTAAAMPANHAFAALPVPPGGGCSAILTHTQKNSTTEVPKITFKCSSNTLRAIELHATFQRQGGGAATVTSIKHSECINWNGVNPFTCTVSAEMYDPSGSQTFFAMFDYEIYRGPGEPVETGKRSLYDARYLS